MQCAPRAASRAYPRVFAIDGLLSPENERISLPPLGPSQPREEGKISSRERSVRKKYFTKWPVCGTSLKEKKKRKAAKEKPKKQG